MSLAKALAAGAAPATAVRQGLDQIAGKDGGVRALLGRTAGFVHGTTLGLNTLITRTGSRVGLLTTKGHEDAVLIGRVHQKIAGLTPEETTRASNLDKPSPLVPRSLIRGVTERIDFSGEVVVQLDERDVLELGRELVEEGCESIAISFLWSFMNDTHEQRARSILTSAFPGLHVSISSEVAPVLGEYERTATCVIDAYLAGRLKSYLIELAGNLRDDGLRGEPFVMTSAGGVVPLDRAWENSVLTLGSGPAAGVIAAEQLGRNKGRVDLITTDVGGTSFDVGLIVDGNPVLTELPVHEQFHVVAPSVDVRSIGAGGGSIAWVDSFGELRVGPRSAGAAPGPVCYGLGGVEPTVTDADLLLGRLREGALLGDRIRLDRGAAERAIADLGAQIGLDAVSCASAILRIIDARMADLVRRVLVEQGLDARRFALVAFGGAGPLHVGAFASDVGVREVIISPNAAVLSAVGLAGADYRVVYLRSEPTIFPGSPKRIESIFRGLEKRAQSEFRRSGIAAELNMQRAIDMRFRRQTHRLTISITDRPVTEAALRRVSDAFETEYERVYGEGTAYRQAGIEASGYRVVATARRVAIPRSPSVPASASLLSETRDVYFEKWQRTAVFDAASLAPEQSISGPALVEALGTTVLIHPDQSLLVDSAGDLVMTIQP